LNNKFANYSLTSHTHTSFANLSLSGTLTVTGATTLNGNISLSTSAQTYLKNIMYPVGIVVERIGNTNPSGFFGGTWVLVGVTGTNFIIGTKTMTRIIYSGNIFTFHVNCSNSKLGNYNQSYEFSTYGIIIEPGSSDLIPMNLMIYNNNGQYLTTYADNDRTRIYKKSATKIEVDTTYGNTTKEDYPRLANFENAIECKTIISL
jgi:hypothetical protein